MATVLKEFQQIDDIFWVSPHQAASDTLHHFYGLHDKSMIPFTLCGKWQLSR